MAKKKASIDVEVLKKHHFWIIAGSITLLSMIAWWIASGSIRDETEQNISRIRSEFSSLARISKEKEHPNKHTHTMMEQEWKKHQTQLFNAWALQVKDQQKNLVWPEQMVEHVQGLMPVELKVQFPEANEIDPPIRVGYSNWVKDLVPQLATVIDARWMANIKETENEGIVDDGLVAWAKGSQASIRDRFQTFKTRVPSTMEVMYAQEDLWVLTTVMKAIAKTNENATARYNASVRELIGIDIAKGTQTIHDVVLVRGEDGRPKNASASGGDEEGGGMMGNMMSMMGGGEGGGEGGPGGGGPGGPGGGGGGPGGPEGGGGEGGEGGPGGMGNNQQKDPNADHPANLRYVDNQDKPIEAARLKEAFESRKAEDAFLALAKRIPVRFRVRMDVHKLPSLLAACGNSPLPIQVRQVRINGSSALSMNATSGGGTGDSMGGGMGGMSMDGGGGGPGGPGGGGGGMEMMMQNSGNGTSGSGGGSRRSRVAANREIAAVYPFQEEVEIYAVVYIFNPVNKDVLQMVETEEKGEEGGEPGAASDGPDAGQGDGPDGPAPPAGDGPDGPAGDDTANNTQPAGPAGG